MNGGKSLVDFGESTSKSSSDAEAVAEGIDRSHTPLSPDTRDPLSGVHQTKGLRHFTSYIDKPPGDVNDDGAAVKAGASNQTLESGEIAPSSSAPAGSTHPSRGNAQVITWREIDTVTTKIFVCHKIYLCSIF